VIDSQRAQVIAIQSLQKEFDPMKSTRKTPGDLPVLLFRHQKDWAAWLDKNHAAAPGVWLRLAKKASDLQSVSYQEALTVALCYGWIDGQKKGLDASSWLQRFVPRGPKSIWSKINREKAQELIASGQMKPAGLAAVTSAQQDGRWAAAYDSQRNASVPNDFQAALDRNAKARAFFASLNSVNRYAILHRIQTAKKTETRTRRIAQFIDMLERNEKIHP
jgi:uncharacterized protein YdeI (YjbR/CyaY-like superfamily)